MIDCSCYRDEINYLGKRGVCWGTKEMEPCSCGGDAAKCDFYPSVREEDKKPITNADRIRAMSDEELDKFLGDVQWDTANYCGGVTQKQDYPLPEQRGAWLDWLRQEAIEDHKE